MKKQKITKWVPTTNLMMLCRMGKLGEELNELGAVTNRCIIQGIDEIDPSSGKVNRLRLEEEIADVIAQCEVTIAMLGLRGSFLADRIEVKKDAMHEWASKF